MSEFGLLVEGLDECLIFLADELAFDLVGRCQLSCHHIKLVWQDHPFLDLGDSINCTCVRLSDTIIDIAADLTSGHSLINSTDVAESQLRADESLCIFAQLLSVDTRLRFFLYFEGQQK